MVFGIMALNCISGAKIIDKNYWGENHFENSVPDSWIFFWVSRKIPGISEGFWEFPRDSWDSREIPVISEGFLAFLRDFWDSQEIPRIPGRFLGFPDSQILDGIPSMMYEIFLFAPLKSVAHFQIAQVHIGCGLAILRKRNTSPLFKAHP